MTGRKLLGICIIGSNTKKVLAWVDHYDAGEDDEKVIKVMLPMVAIAVLACVLGYYIKNKFFKDDEDKEEQEKNEQKKTSDMRFPAPKANKPWLANLPQQGQTHKPIGPTGGYEFTLPGYQQTVSDYKHTKGSGGGRTVSHEKKSNSHQVKVHNVSEKRPSRSKDQQKTKSIEKTRSYEKTAPRSSERKSRESKMNGTGRTNTGQHRSQNQSRSGAAHARRTERANPPNYQQTYRPR